MSTVDGRYSVLGNALAMLCGLGDSRLPERLVSGKNMILVSLSMVTFLYDALLAADGIIEVYFTFRIYKLKNQ